MEKRTRKLGMFVPLIGTWEAEADSPRGLVKCQRSFNQVLNKTYISLRALWHIGNFTYEEVALFGSNRDGKLCLWSFTSDGKQSQGQRAEIAEIHLEAFGFEAQMPAGIARQIYWPDDTDGFYWAVESQTKNGWNRFTEHHYHKTES